MVKLTVNVNDLMHNYKFISGFVVGTRMEVASKLVNGAQDKKCSKIKQKRFVSSCLLNLILL